MANYVAFLADSFRTATEKGYTQICQKRQTRAIQMMAKGDYIPCDTALAIIGELSRKVIASKTKSAIADSELSRAARILACMGQHTDARITNLMALEKNK